MGNGMIRAKAWPKDTEEPDEWTLEVEHANAHSHGAPGIYAMSHRVKRKFTSTISQSPKINLEQTNISMKKIQPSSFLFY